MAKKIYTGQSFLWQWLFTFWVLYCLICPFRVELHAAWEEGYTHRKLVTVQHANLDADLTHYPLLVKRVDADIDDNCDDDGAGSWDIMFTESDGTSDLDIDWIDYSEAGGEATIIARVSQAGWVLDNDAAPAATKFYCYYENAGAGDPGTSAGVYDANFVGVYHMKDGADTSHVNDSTSAANTGTKAGANEPIEATGKIYKGQDYDGEDGTPGDDIDLGTQAEHEDIWDGGGTFSIWAYKNGAGESNAGRLANKTSPGWEFMHTTDDLYFTQDFDDTDGGWRTQDDAITNGSWYYISWTYNSDAAANNPTMYLNNAVYTVGGGNNLDEYSTPVGTRVSDSTDNLTFGCQGAARQWDGILEEVMLSDSIRSGDWAKFQFYNDSEADHELTWGSEESESSYVQKVIIIMGGYVLPGFIFVKTRRKKKK